MPKLLSHRYTIDPLSGCWVWGGSLSPAGYGPYRLYYRRLVGEYPRGLTLDHLCRNRACVNPDHLEVVTRRVNTLRGIAPPAVNARKTHCIKGHEFTPENTIKTRDGRGCRECRRIYFREFRKAHRERLGAQERERHVRRRDTANAGRRRRYQQERRELRHIEECSVCGTVFVAEKGTTCSRSCRIKLGRRRATPLEAP